MDSFELNKVMGAVLGVLLLAMGLNISSGILFTPKKPAVTGYDLPSPEPEAAAPGDQAAQAVPLPILLASADAGKGEATAKKCVACHNFEKGGPNKIGPNLFGVVERTKGSHEGFAYSSAMKGKGGNWSFADLDGFIANPKGWLPGTIMAFAGIGNPKERSDVLAYLRKLADSPVALPDAPAADATAQPASASGPAQTQQQVSPPAPGQRAEPAPAAVPAQPQPAAQQVQPTVPNQPQPAVTGANPGGASPLGAGSPTAAPSQAPAAAQPAPPSQTPTDPQSAQ